MPGPTTDTTADGSEGRISQLDACITGHVEARARLKRVGWEYPEIGTLEDACDGPVDFARCVADEVRRAAE